LSTIRRPENSKHTFGNNRDLTRAIGPQLNSAESGQDKWLSQMQSAV